MRIFFLLALAGAYRQPFRPFEPKCVDCEHMIGREPGRCALFPNLLENIFEEIKPRFDFTPCPVARRYASLCGKKGKRFRNRVIDR
jgi:hypothetical protein